MYSFNYYLFRVHVNVILKYRCMWAACSYVKDIPKT